MSKPCHDRVFDLALNGRTYLVPQACPHRGGFLRLGTLDAQRGTLTCPLHHAIFDVASGKRLSGPPCGDLRMREAAAAASGVSQEPERRRNV